MMYRIAFFWIVLCQAALLQAQCNGLWTGAVDNTWNNPGNWGVLSCVPNGVSDTASFFSATAPAGIDLDISPQLLSLTFDTAAQSYTIFGNGNTLSVQDVNVFSGSHVIENSTIEGVVPNALSLDVVGKLSVESSSHVLTAVGQIVISGTGTLVLDSSSTMNAGSFVNQSGATFINNGFVSAGSGYQLSAPGVASGTGSYFVNMINGGTVIPGDTKPGPLFVDLYTQNPGGTLTIQFLDDAHVGLLNTSVTSLVGGNLVLEGLPNFKIQTNHLYTILTSYPTPILGFFDNVINAVSPYLEPVVFILPNSIEVEFLDIFPGYLSPRDAIFSTQNQITYLLLRKMDRMLVTGCCDCGWDAFVAPLGSSGAVHGKDDFLGYSFYTAGFIVGGDYTSPAGGLGVAIDYEHLSLIGKQHWGWVDVNRLHANFYGTAQIIDCLYANGIIGVGHDWHNFQRREFPGLSSFARSSPHSTEWNALIGVEWTAHVFQLTFIPFVDYQYQFLDIKRTVERADDPFYALTFDPQRYSSHKSLVGLRLNIEQSTLPFCLLTELNVAWAREFGTTSRVVTNSLLPLLNPAIGRNTILLGIDLETPISDKFFLEFNYEFEGNIRYLNNFFYLSLNTSF